MLSRRTLLAAAGALPALPRLAAAAPRPPAPPATGPDEAPEDEALWARVAGEFTLDRTVVNLNNGGCCPTPRVVHEALERYLDLSNTAPVYAMWQLLEPGVESVRRELAAEAGCDPEELAVTRNASEALQTAQLGLSLAPGDEVLTTDQDYPRMLDTWEQRVRRDGIVLKKVAFPVPLLDPAPLLDALRAALTPRTKVLHVSHVVFLTGQVLPVKALCAFAREHGLVSIVDGAHAFAHVPVDLHDLGCDYYGTSLHKWLLAPVGTGFLYVRRPRIRDHWPLTPAAASLAENIRKFEEIGTHPAANHDAVAEALVFHRGIGRARKHARVHALRRRAELGLAGLPNLRLHTPADPALSGAIGLVEVVGVEPGKLTAALWERWRILATPITHPAFRGVRITPNVYTLPREIDVFVEAMRVLAAEAPAAR